MIYSVWEGFIKNAFSKYLVELGKLKLKLDKLHINYVVHSINSECQLSDGRTSLTTQSKLVEKILDIVNDEIDISQKVPTKSNVNYKVLNQITELFNLGEFDKSYKSPLDKLLLFRNKISHGENAVVVNIEDINLFSKLVEDLMSELILKLENGVEKKCYEKQP